MTVPDYQTIMLPLLQLAADGEAHRMRDVIEEIGDHFGLGDDEREEKLPSGRQAKLSNRVGWARTYMKKAGLLESPQRGYFKITDAGLQALKQTPDAIDVKFLEQYEGFLEFKAKSADKSHNTAADTKAPTEERTPREVIDEAYVAIRGGIASDLLEQIMQGSPSFFEKLVVDLLVGMGYGGSRKEAGKAVGKSGDEGIDGMINEDRLGLEVVYIQAKRWQNVVGRPEIQKFVGALRGKNARKGVFITPSGFTKEARDYARGLQDKVVLIDGQMLADLMIDHGVGVTLEDVYEIKRVDSDYFDEA